MWHIIIGLNANVCANLYASSVNTDIWQSCISVCFYVSGGGSETLFEALGKCEKSSSFSLLAALSEWMYHHCIQVHVWFFIILYSKKCYGK